MTDPLSFIDMVNDATNYRKSIKHMIGTSATEPPRETEVDSEGALRGRLSTFPRAQAVGRSQGGCRQIRKQSVGRFGNSL